MNVFLKRWAITAIAVVTMSVAAYAQEQGDMAAGVNVVVSSEEELARLGICGKFKYNVSDPLRLEGALTLFSKVAHTSTYDLSVNAHWLVPVVEDQLLVYPLAGLGLYTVRVSNSDYSNSESRVGFNLGFGADFIINDNISLNYELKYKFISLDDDDELSKFYTKMSFITIGIAFNF